MSNDAPSPFDTLETAFRLLTTGPSPLSVDGRTVCGLPDRPFPLDELGSQLLDPSISYHTRDVALAVLLRRAKRNGGAWTVGLAGVLLPGLRRAAAPLAKAMPGKAADLEAEMLAALVETIAVLPARADRIAARWSGQRSAPPTGSSSVSGRGGPGRSPTRACPPRAGRRPIRTWS